MNKKKYALCCFWGNRGLALLGSMKKIVLIISILLFMPFISVMAVNLFTIGNGHVVIVDDQVELEQLLGSYQPMVLDKYGSELKYDKAYQYCDLPFFFQKFKKPLYADIINMKDAMETAFQDSGWLIVSEITTINDMDYYINVAIGDYNYQGKTEVYCLTAMTYVDGQAFRVFTECLKEDYTQAYNTFIGMLKKISVQ